MRLILAFKAFFKALKDPKAAEKFVAGTSNVQEKVQDSSDLSHIRLLAILQQSGRLIDFFKENISGFEDAQIGAIARKIHEDCANSIEELVTIRPVMIENEGAMVQVLPGYDPASIKLVGKIKGEPPFKGVLVHKGWKAHKRSLPKNTGLQASEVICPAEIEVR